MRVCTCVYVICNVYVIYNVYTHICTHILYILLLSIIYSWLRDPVEFF